MPGSSPLIRALIEKHFPDRPRVAAGDILPPNYDWSRWHRRCAICGGTDSPHQAKGVCHACTESLRRIRKEDEERARVNKYNRRYYRRYTKLITVYGLRMEGDDELSQRDTYHNLWKHVKRRHLASLLQIAEQTDAEGLVCIEGDPPVVETDDGREIFVCD